MNKKEKEVEQDELRAEYDFSKMVGAVRGKYAEQYHAGTNLLPETEERKSPGVDEAKRRRLEAHGWRFGDAADFLELTPEERAMVDACLEAAKKNQRK